MSLHLTRTPASAGQPLDVNGRSLLASHEQIVSILRSRLGQAHGQLLATPRQVEGGEIDWSTPLSGTAAPASTLSAEERARLEQWSARLLNDIRSLGGRLREEGQAASMVGHMIEQAIRHPAGDWLYGVDGKPVLVMWGHAEAGGASVPWVAPPPPPVKVPPPMSGPPATPATPVIAAATASQTPAAGRPQPRWWMLAVLLLLLAAIASLLGLRGCIPMVGREGPDAARIAEIDAANARLEEEIARTREQTPKFMCVRPPTTEPPRAEVAVTPEPAPEPPKVAGTPPADRIKEVRDMCPGQRPKELAPQMVLVFDASGSMAFNAEATEQEIDRLTSMNAVQGMMRQFGLGGQRHPEMARLTREPTRISSARQAALAVVRRVPSDMGIGLVLVDQCPAARNAGFFPPARRGELLSGLQGVEPREGTPLADGVAKGGQLVDGVSRDALMVVISDGRESCGQDPCAVGRALARAKPQLKINVVDILGTGAGNCLAQATGGRVFTARNAGEVAAMTRRAAEEAMAPSRCDKS